MKSKYLALKYLLNSRLPDIDRWKNVEVIEPGKLHKSKNKYIQQVFNDDGKHFGICWTNSKSNTNTHPYELKEVPVEHIDIIIQRNANNLKDKRKRYK